MKVFSEEHQRASCWQSAASIKNRCPSPFNEQASGYSVKSLTSKFLVLFWTSLAQLVLLDLIILFMIPSLGPKWNAAKGISPQVLFLMNFGGMSHQLYLLLASALAHQRWMYTALLYPCQNFIPELSRKAFVPPNSRKQQVPKLSNSPWRQQRKAMISVHGEVPLPDTVPASDPACLVGLLHVQKSQDFRNRPLFSKSFSQDSVFNSAKRDTCFQETVGFNHSAIKETQ